MLLPALVEGRVDLVAAQVTVRAELQKLVDFTDPTRTNVSQILVTGPGAPAIASVEDLSGKEVFARERSAYDQSLVALNETFKAQGKPPVVIQAAPPNLEDDDLLEMVNAGLIPAVVVDDYLANFWKQVFPNITVHDNVAVRTGGTLAIAVRKNSPQLTSALNTFMGKYGLGTAFGNQIERKYLVNTTYAKNATSEAGRKKFQAVVELFRKYSDQYQRGLPADGGPGVPGIPAQSGRQEPGRRDRHHAGHAGHRQGAERRRHHPDRARTSTPGVKYMRFMIDRYYEDEPMDDAEQGAVHVRVLQRGAGPGPPAAEGSRKAAGSTRTSGSATWSRSRPSASAARR